MQRELSDTGVSAEEAHKKLGEFGDHAKTAFKDVMKAAAAVTAAVLAIGKQALETGTEFDSSMSQVAATLGYSTDELNDSGSEAAETLTRFGSSLVRWARIRLSRRMKRRRR